MNLNNCLQKYYFYFVREMDFFLNYFVLVGNVGFYCIQQHDTDACMAAKLRPAALQKNAW